jgi:hypothetical protein
MSGIAIAGRAGSGKSTLAREVVALLGARGLHAEVVSFATELKREVWELYGLKKGDVGSREALIEHGERRRAEDPLYWVRLAEPRFHELWQAGAVPVCDDLRRLPEFSWLAAHAFYKVRVTAPEERRRARLAAQGLNPDFAVTDDPTEVDHEGWLFDRRVHNAGPRHLHHLAIAVVDRVLELGIVKGGLPDQKKGAPQGALWAS